MFRFIGLTIFLFVSLSFATAPDTLWTRMYGTNQDDALAQIIECVDGGYVLIGSTGSHVLGGEDMLIIRIDFNGNIIWTRTYGGEDTQLAFSGVQTSDLGFLFVGYTYTATNSEDVFIVKTNSNGDTLWTRTIGDGYGNRGYSVMLTNDGFVVIGRTRTRHNSNETSWDAYLIKLSILGEVLWTRSLGGRYDQYIWSAKQTVDSGFVITGIENRANDSDVSFYMYAAKTNSSGDSLWSHHFRHIYSYESGGYDIAATQEGNMLVAGYFGPTDGSANDMFILKLDSTGDSLWQNGYGGEGGDEAHAIATTSDGGFIAAGLTSSFGLSSYNMYVIRADSSGDTLWTANYGTYGVEQAECAIQTSDGGYLIGGFSLSSPITFYDFYVVKLAPEDNTSAQDLRDILPQKISLSAYPNPFNPSAELRFNLPKSERVSLTAYDISGRKIRSIANDLFSAGEHQFIFNGENLPTGTYLVNLETESGISQTQKLILLK